jgi:hypothetical protein
MKWFHGEDATTATRAGLTPAPVRWFAANLLAGGAVNLTGVLGYPNTFARPANLTNPGHPLVNNILPTPDNTFRLFITGNSLNTTGATGNVDQILFNNVAQNPAGINIQNPFAQHPGGGQLIPPAPTSAGVGSAAAYISELNLTATVSGGAASSAANSATQEANAISNSVTTTNVEEGQGSSDAGGRGPSQTADLGRGGSSGDVFGTNFHVADGGGAGPNADSQYFSETPFQSAERRRRQQ